MDRAQHDLLSLLLNAVCFAFIVAFLLRYIFFRGSDLEKKRCDELSAVARKLNLHFNPDTDFKLAEQFAFLSRLRQGDTRFAYNVFRGYHAGFPVLIFDYHFAIYIAGNKGVVNKCDFYWSVLILEMKTHFPDITIGPENWRSRLAEMVGKAEISFESAEFSHAFRVRTSDKKFAFDVCHPRMMEYLLANCDLAIEIEGPALALIFETWLRPSEVERNLSRLIEIRKLLPEYLITKT